MTSRRTFLGAAIAGAAFAATTPRGEFPYAEFEARIARRDFRGITRDVLPTPPVCWWISTCSKGMWRPWRNIARPRASICGRT